MAVQTNTTTDEKHSCKTPALSITPYYRDEWLVDQVRSSLQLATRYAFNRRHNDGHWCGELKSNATITAEYVMMRQALGLDMSLDRDELVAWFLADQQRDGSWAIAPGYPGDVSTTTEAYFALKLLGAELDMAPLRHAREYILSAGGVAKVRIFTRIYLATFGLFPWKAVPELPAELILVPAIAPISIYRLSSWARSTIVPLLIVSHHRPIYPLPNGKSAANDFLDEIWQDSSNKHVPYSPSLWGLWKTDAVAFTFTALDIALHWVGGLRSSPSRAYARRKCVEWILEHQEEEGDWAGIFPPMHVGVLALCLEGYKHDDLPVWSALEAIERFAWLDGGKKRIQACLSPVWDTILMTIGLCDAGYKGRLSTAIDWITSRQLLGTEGDWRIYKPDVPPGGFSFEYFNRWYPDVDDTAAAILAMLKQDPQLRNSLPVRKAVVWILGMQNCDGGWGAFDVNNDKLFLNKIPFSDMESLCDPSTADVTGRILEAFGLIMQLSFGDPSNHSLDDLIDQMNLACCRAISYLAHHQEPSGSWYGRWGSNYIYGTSNVLCGLAYFSAGCTSTAQGDDAVKEHIDSAIHWLKSIQNPDGGWGETLMSYKDARLAGQGPSTASQTAWALMGLLSSLPPTEKVVQDGVRYLLRTQTRVDNEGEASWPETLYTGTGFPNHFYLGYSFYPHYFPMMALGRYVQLTRRPAPQA
ncbi:uncharacterized protein N7446_004476 [Penicillium canescens]|uniref:Terpene cyclase/mutase family member n=1 Tax=Penicillium canescens TaxID=5083 RepID=A0AAD6N3S5_PENCN|nr:uncharacterized protein N7446_004476 [Penicillium canescens]KAJ6026921.1 hypothetical protein N7460_011738 [Penicillium canescens]KAJ6040205.1 hypothetical protein N7444_009110 [Penicillium canescens]KAJ6067439.1 hypothetical protein N7446_004476 [Penicillium canescens]